MIKYIILIMASFWVTACAAHDEHYYSSHPQLLQKAIENCPEKSPANISCEQLKTVAMRVNDLAYELRSNPQGYGQKILALQTEVAKQESSLRENPDRPELRSSLAQNKQQLQECLSVVKWLESPES